ncbi:MAG: transposase, partial [Acidobacteria bacterium]|nr:transposase [Acidobacteriota bacterium]
DSLSIRHFLRVGLDEQVPDHSTLSRNRRLISLETRRGEPARKNARIAKRTL